MLTVLAAKRRTDQHCSFDYNLSNSAISVQAFKGERLVGGKKASPRGDRVMRMCMGRTKELRNGGYLIESENVCWELEI